MNRQLIILGLALLLLGCTDKGVEPKTSAQPVPVAQASLEPGVVAVFFTEGTTLQEAQTLVESLGLSFKFAPTGTPLNGVLSVPVGSEDEWVVKLKTYPIVKSAGRIGVISQQ